MKKKKQILKILSLIFILVITLMMLLIFLYHIIFAKGKDDIDNNYTKHYKIVTEDISELSNGEYSVLAIHNGISYMAREINIVYVKYDKTKISIFEAEKNNYITLKEIVNYMTPISDDMNFYKYDGTNEISKDKFSILICKSKIVIDTYENNKIIESFSNDLDCKKE